MSILKNIDISLFNEGVLVNPQLNTTTSALGGSYSLVASCTGPNTTDKGFFLVHESLQLKDAGQSFLFEKSDPKQSVDILFRIQSLDPLTCYRIRFLNDDIEIFRVISGTSTLLATQAFTGLNSTSIVFRVAAQISEEGIDVVVWNNTTDAVIGTLGAIDINPDMSIKTTGRIGIIMNMNEDTNNFLRLDNWTIEDFD